jgi:mannitol/fructose-specific phosphotransferase system IIA component (Ntr-type)
MNTSLLKKNISNIKLSKSNSNINFFASKNSFLDRNFSSIKDVVLEIQKVGENEFGLLPEQFKLTKEKNINSQFISLDNGILLINSFFKELKKNCLIFFRLEKPILYDIEKSTDIIFTLITPCSIKTSSKLQILAKLTRILKNPNIRKEIKGVKKAEDVLALLLLPST